MKKIYKLIAFIMLFVTCLGLVSCDNTKKTEKEMGALFVGVWVFGLVAMVALKSWVF